MHSQEWDANFLLTSLFGGKPIAPVYRMGYMGIDTQVSIRGHT